MNVAVIDSDIIALNRIKNILFELSFVSNVYISVSENEFLDSIRRSPPNVAIIEIDAHSINGVRLKRELSKISPNSKVIFLVKNRESGITAFEEGGDGCLLLPVDGNKVACVLSELSGYD